MRWLERLIIAWLSSFRGGRRLLRWAAAAWWRVLANRCSLAVTAAASVRVVDVSPQQRDSLREVFELAWDIAAALDAYVEPAPSTVDGPPTVAVVASSSSEVLPCTRRNCPACDDLEYSRRSAQ